MTDGKLYDLIKSKCKDKSVLAAVKSVVKDKNKEIKLLKAEAESLRIRMVEK